MNDKTFLTAGEVARRLGLTTAGSFLRVRARLETDQDFPPPFPVSARPLKWRADAVDGWIDGQGRATPAPIVAGPNVHLLQLARQA